MSLRRDIHSAYDNISPSTTGLSERVIQTVLSEGPIRRRRERFMFRMRAPLSLVAVLIGVAPVAAVLVGGRIIADWNGHFNPAPAGQPRSQLPEGGPVPSELRGDWIMTADEAKAIAGDSCPDPLSIATCMFKLTFTTATYTWTSNIPDYFGGGGEVVVKSSEIDFFNGRECQIQGLEGVGRYRWELIGGVLRFTALNNDPCPRQPC